MGCHIFLKPMESLWREGVPHEETRKWEILFSSLSLSLLWFWCIWIQVFLGWSLEIRIIRKITFDDEFLSWSKSWGRLTTSHKQLILLQLRARGISSIFTLLSTSSDGAANNWATDGLFSVERHYIHICKILFRELHGIFTVMSQGSPGSVEYRTRREEMGVFLLIFMCFSVQNTLSLNSHVVGLDAVPFRL